MSCSVNQRLTVGLGWWHTFKWSLYSRVWPSLNGGDTPSCSQQNPPQKRVFPYHPNGSPSASGKFLTTQLLSGLYTSPPSIGVRIVLFRAWHTNLLCFFSQAHRSAAFLPTTSQRSRQHMQTRTAGTPSCIMSLTPTGTLKNVHCGCTK